MLVNPFFHISVLFIVLDFQKRGSLSIWHSLRIIQSLLFSHEFIDPSIIIFSLLQILQHLHRVIWGGRWRLRIKCLLLESFRVLSQFISYGVSIINRISFKESLRGLRLIQIRELLVSFVPSCFLALNQVDTLVY